MAETPRPPFSLPDSLAEKEPKEAIEELLRFLRMGTEFTAQQIGKVNRLMESDFRKKSDRVVADGMNTQGGEVRFDKATMPLGTQVLYILGAKTSQSRYAVFGDMVDTSPTDPGPGPLFGTTTVTVRKNSGANVGTRPRLNLIEGANITLTVTDDAVGNEVDITVTGTASSGWTDGGTTVYVTTTTDDVSIGTSASPGARLGIFNTVTTKISLLIQAVASQTAATLRIITSAGLPGLRHTISATLSKLIIGDAETPTVAMSAMIAFDYSAGAGGGGPTHAIVTWGDNVQCLSAPGNTADELGVAGARFYPFKDTIGTGPNYDTCYGQDQLDAWVLISDETITYSIWSGRSPSVTPWLRAQWNGVGDLTNYGLVHIRKNLTPASSTVAASTPQLRLEETGSGTQVVSLRAPAAVTADRVQLLFNMTGTHPLVGDDPPAVAAGAMGKVDSTAQAAAIASTNLTNGALAGLYLVEYTLLVTTADVTAGTIQMQASYTDTLGATNQTGAAVALTATGRQSGQFVVQLASGELSYQTNLVGIIGASRYALYTRLMYLG